MTWWWGWESQSWQPCITVFGLMNGEAAISRVGQPGGHEPDHLALVPGEQRRRGRRLSASGPRPPPAVGGGGGVPNGTSLVSVVAVTPSDSASVGAGTPRRRTGSMGRTAPYRRAAWCACPASSPAAQRARDDDVLLPGVPWDFVVPVVVVASIAVEGAGRVTGGATGGAGGIVRGPLLVAPGATS